MVARIVSLLAAVAGCAARRIRLHHKASTLRKLRSGLASPAPLVAMMHGGFGSAEQAERAYGWDELANAAKFAVAHPDAVGRAWNVNGGCCSRPGRENIDEVGFITAVVDDVAANVAVDPRLRYATGISNVDGCAPPATATDGAVTTIGRRSPRTSNL